jgi:DNA-binding SARP family transcriptional activator
VGQSEQGPTAASGGASGSDPTVSRARRGGASPSPWRLRLLGRFTVEAGGAPVADADLGNRKARLLLKLLAVRRGHQVPMDAIIEALWADDTGDARPALRPVVRPVRPVENVATLVSRLRATLGPEAIDGGRAGYRLVLPPGCTVDADDAQRLVEEAERRLAAVQPALAVTAADRALLDVAGGIPLEEEST